MLFIVDFDGTISKKDTIDALLEKFADPAWEDVEQEWLDGKIDAVECMSKQINMVRADHIALENFFRGIELDRGFIPFYDYISPFAKLVVASDGLDHAIKIAFRHANFPQVPIFSNHLNFTPNGIEMTFPNRKHDCKGGNGNCKCSVAKSLSQNAGEKVVLIGDGKSDACLAHHADFVFAKGKLIKHCEENHIPHHAFSTFEDVLAIVKAWPNEHLQTTQNHQNLA